jgi:hypothetical protein
MIRQFGVGALYFMLMQMGIIKILAVYFTVLAANIFLSLRLILRSSQALDQSPAAAGT